jgi:D-arginine dehydrogenase
MERFDIAIVGAGIAGASLAARLAGKARVVLLEAEDRPGYHATGRSAAFWTESYGGPDVLPLTSASGPMLREHGLMTPRGSLTLARQDQLAELEGFAEEFGAAGVRVEMLEGDALSARVSGLRADWVRGAYEPDCCDIDVAGLHQYFLSVARSGGVELRCHARLEWGKQQGQGWRIALEGGGEFDCDLLVNAAGAWADEVAARVEAPPLRIQPYRRTVAQIRTAPLAPADLPLVFDIDGTFYFKPEAGRLWLSPHDETPSPPCDAAPEELDVALAIDRFEAVVDWRIERVEHKWAGLRSFAPDRLPIYGMDPACRGLFWCAGQGGFGIQTAPAAADLAARLLLGEKPGAVDPAPYLPCRFR